MVRAKGSVPAMGLEPFTALKGFVSYHGDAETVLRRMPAASIDCVVTSPPYYSGRSPLTAPGEIDHEASLEAYVGRLTGVGRELLRVVKRRGSVWMILGDTRRGKDWLGVPWSVALAVMSEGWRLRDSVIWCKSATGGSKDRLAPAHEQVFHFVRSANAYYRMDALRGATGSRRAVTAKAPALSDVWSVPSERTAFRDFAVVPEALVERPILTTCPPRGTVLDPFLGSGTTAAVALRLGRSAVGIDFSTDSLLFSGERVRKILQRRLHGRSRVRTGPE